MKTVFITGTSRGLGRHLAQTFLDQQWKVIGASRSQPSIDHHCYSHLCLDLQNIKELTKLDKDIDHIDMLINNAAVFKMKKFVDMSLDDINEILDVNLKNTVLLTKILINKINKLGKIVFINSVAGVNDINEQSIYCASKQGLKAFANILSNELRPNDIKIISIYPGGINTTLWNNHNCYPNGDVNKTLDPQWLSKFIFDIANCSGSVDFKNITLFPDHEQH